MPAVFQGCVFVWCKCVMDCNGGGGGTADIEGHSICIPTKPEGGPSLSCTAVPAAQAPFPSPHFQHRKQAARADLGSAT